MENREMQTSNTEEMVTISRAEYERLQQEKARNAKLEAKLAAREQEQAQVITSLTLQNEWLLEQLKLSKKKLFGRSSEQAEQMVMDQLSLTYNELEAYAFGTKAATEKQIAVKAHERKRQSGNVLDVVPEGTPTEVVEHRLPENERTLLCLRQQIGGDWQGSPPQLNDETGRVLGARGRVLHLRLQELRAGDR